MARSLSGLVGAQTRGSVLDMIAHPAVVDPLAAQQRAAGTAQNVLQVRSSVAQQRLGELAQQAIDPTTKQFDPNRFNALVAGAGPDVAMGAQAALQRSSDLSGTQLDQAAKKIAWYAGATGSMPDNASVDDINKVIDGGVASGFLTPTQAQLEKSGVPSDPAQRAAYIQQHRLWAADAQTRLNQQYGPIVGVSQGTGTQFVNVPPQGSSRPLPNVPNYGTPEWWYTQKVIPDLNKTLPDGSPNPNYGKQVAISPAEWVKKFPNMPIPPQFGGAPPDLGTGRPPNAALTNPNKPPPSSTPPSTTTPPPPSTSTTAPPPQGTAPGAEVVTAAQAEAARTKQSIPVGNLAGLYANPDGTLGDAKAPIGKPPAPAPQAAPAAPAARAPFIVGPSPGEEGTMKGSPAQFQAESDKGTSATQQLATLGTMLADSSQFTPGFWANRYKSFREFALGTPVMRQLATSFGMSADSVAASESFDKLVNQLLTQQGANSDQRMAINVEATPHSTLTGPGVDLILRQLQGNSDYILARSKLADAYPNRDDYPGFHQRYAALDPRAFQFNRMTNEQRKTYFDSLDTNARSELDKSLDYLNTLKAQKLL